MYDSKKITQEQLQRCIKTQDYQFRIRFSGDFPAYEISTENFNPRKFAEAVELYPGLSYLVHDQNNFHKAQVHLEVQS